MYKLSLLHMHSNVFKDGFKSQRVEGWDWDVGAREKHLYVFWIFNKENSKLFLWLLASFPRKNNNNNKKVKNLFVEKCHWLAPSMW